MHRLGRQNLAICGRQVQFLHFSHDAAENDPILQEHVQKVKKMKEQKKIAYCGYMSHAIQEEIIELIGKYLAKWAQKKPRKIALDLAHWFDDDGDL